MSVISKETFEKFTAEEKEKVRRAYQTLKLLKTDLTDYYSGKFTELETLFGEENLQYDLKIRTVKDIDELYEKWPSTELDDKVEEMCSAATQISKLIEFGYGGVVTDTEWEECINEGTGVYTIVWNPLYKSFHIKCESEYKCFLAFHTMQQAQDFMSYQENIELLRQYYCLD